MKKEPKYTREHYPSKVEQYMDLIVLWRTSSEYDFNGIRIFRELKARGYIGTINPIYRALKKIDEVKLEIPKEATTRVETPPGDQAQFDWAHYEMNVAGIIRTVYCFSMILAASRKKAIIFSLSSDADAIYEAIQELYDNLGGITLELIIDNPKALVIENNPKSNIGKALQYALNHKEKLETYLEDGNCVISNNIAENSINPFTVGRKNWIFCGSSEGANASACVYSLIETAKANGLSPYKYLEFLLSKLPESNIKTNPKVLDLMMPWYDLIQKMCKFE